MFFDEEVRARYGAHVIVSRKDDFVLVHLDQPDDAELQSRTEVFDSRKYDDKNYPLFTLQRASGIYVLDEVGKFIKRRNSPREVECDPPEKFAIRTERRRLDACGFDAREIMIINEVVPRHG